MNVEFLTSSAVNAMEKALADPEIIRQYESGTFKALVPRQAIRSSRFNSAEPPDLEGLTSPKDDAAASKLIHGWLRRMDPSSAADGRLWTLLSHHTFADYSAGRWGGSVAESSKKQNVILTRFFMRGDSIERLFRNSIGRLWWFGHVCFDESRPDPYELLPVLLSLQDIQSALLERRIGMCRPLLTAVLELVQESGGVKGEVIKEVGRSANFIGGGVVLDCLTKDELKNRLRAMFK